MVKAAGHEEASANDNSPVIEHRIRERAYFLWEREGRPSGRAVEFWERACREETGRAA
jgi:hypothetical protein